ncbi:MAG: DUF6719 family protein [Rhizobiaceae bacterium]
MNAAPARYSQTLAAGNMVLVDDGSCPEGQIKQVAGGGSGMARKRDCVARPTE